MQTISGFGWKKSKNEGNLRETENVNNERNYCNSEPMQKKLTYYTQKLTLLVFLLNNIGF